LQTQAFELDRLESTEQRIQWPITNPQPAQAMIAVTTEADTIDFDAVHSDPRVLDLDIAARGGETQERVVSGLSTTAPVSTIPMTSSGENTFRKHINPPVRIPIGRKPTTLPRSVPGSKTRTHRVSH
jgi:hypothetical protein